MIQQGTKAFMTFFFQGVYDIFFSRPTKAFYGNLLGFGGGGLPKGVLEGAPEGFQVVTECFEAHANAGKLLKTYKNAMKIL